MTSERAIPHLRDIFGIGSQAFHQPAYDPPQKPNLNSFENLNDKKCNKKPGKKSSKKDNYKTLTSGDVKTLERHLSMKKTIRKKIMRDLQQAFVEDPNEFKVENTNPEKLKSELSAEAVKFGEKNNRKTGGDPNFLDMLRGEVKRPEPEPRDENETGDSAETGCEKTSFWRRFTMKNKNKR